MLTVEPGWISDINIEFIEICVTVMSRDDLVSNTRGSDMLQPTGVLRTFGLPQVGKGFFAASLDQNVLKERPVGKSRLNANVKPNAGCST